MSGPSLEGQRYGKLVPKVLMTTLADDKFEKALDITLLINDMSFYENMIQRAFTVNLNITDSNGYLENYPLTGHEIFKITLEHGIKIDEDDPKWNCLFRIAGIEGFNSSATSKSYLFYRITLISLEGFRNSITQISKYVNDRVGRVVTNILKNDLGTTKTINAKPNAPVSMALTWQSPFEAIKNISAETPISNRLLENPERDFYVFWEDRDSFTFESLRTLEQQAPLYEFKYYEGNLSTQEDSGESGESIISYQIDRGYDIGNSITSGTYYAITTEIDNQGNVIGPPKRTWSYSEPYDTQLARLKKSEVTGNTTDLHTQGSMRRILPHKNAAINLSEKVGFANSYNTVQLTFVVNGNLKFKPGVMCVVNIKTYSAITTDNKASPIFEHISGFFMITSVKHSVLGTTEQQYTCTIQAYKIPDSRVKPSVLNDPEYNDEAYTVQR